MRSPTPTSPRLRVESLEDRLAPAIFYVTSATDAGAGSLRAAITSANALPGADTIRFNIAGTGVHTIDLLAALPLITGTLKLAGRTQPGYAGSPLVELNGAAAGPGDGLAIAPSAAGSIVRAVAVNRFQGDGIRLTADNCRVLGCRIGTDASGSMDLGNGTGIRLTNGASGNVIGGTRMVDRNVISGNSGDGVSITGLETTGNRIRGNLIGTDSTGRLDLGNSLSGILVAAGAADTAIGGHTVAARNIISGNNKDGVHISASANTLVRGNYIGTDRAGSADLGNSGKGIVLKDQASGTVIGGATAGAGNVIAGNGETAVWVQGAGTSGNVIHGNRIGIAAKSAAAIGNDHYGVFIGLGASRNAIGGAGEGEGNVIAHSGMHGVALGAGTGNTILRNRIFENAFLGIDLEADGVTANDLDDLDSGANTRINFPLLETASLTSAGLQIHGSANTQLDQTLRLEFFCAPTLDANGNAQGRRYLGFVVVKTHEGCTVAFNARVPSTGLLAGQYITATATDLYGNTSEFSLGRIIE